MSSLWTPGGEHPVDRPGRGQPDEQPADAAAAFEALSPDEQAQVRAMQAEMAEVRQRLLEVPAAAVVANHAMGLYELAAIHLTAERPDLKQATLAIDGLAALVDGLGDRLGEAASTLREALSQIRAAYVQVRGETESQA